MPSFVDRIKNFWKADKTTHVADKGRGFSLDDPYSGTQASDGIRSLTAALSMDQALLLRYADYENMDDYPELQAALDIYADDSTIPDSVRGKSIWGESRDKIVRDLIDDCLHRRLRIEEDLWLVVRTMCKYGNAYAEIIVSDIGVAGLNFLPVPTMRRIVTQKGDLLGYVQDISGRFEIEIVETDNIKMLKEKFKDKAVTFFEPWEIVHWRLRSKFVNSLYGYSILDAARWIWKRLTLLEDTALVYKLTRSPSRYAFYVDTGDLPPEEAMALVKKVKQGYKKRTLINPTTGELEFRNNPLSPEEDMWIPTRGGKESTRVDVLSGPDWQSIEDIQYFRDKLFTSIKIPQSYFGGEAVADGALAQKDVRFARTCMRIQREFKNGVRHVLRVHMAALGIDPDSVKWETRMTVPSSIFELQQIEVMNAQAGLMSTLSEWFDDSWLLQNVLHFSADDASKVVQDNNDEKEREADNSARIMDQVAKKYPAGVGMGMAQSAGATMGSVPAASESPMAQLSPADMGMESVNSRVNKLLEDVKETRKTQNRVLKSVQDIEPMLNKAVRRLSKR